MSMTGHRIHIESDQPHAVTVDQIFGDWFPDA